MKLVLYLSFQMYSAKISVVKKVDLFFPFLSIIKTSIFKKSYKFSSYVIFFCINRTACCFRKNSVFPVFDGFIRFKIFLTRFDGFQKMNVCLSQKFCGKCNWKIYLCSYLFRMQFFFLYEIRTIRNNIYRFLCIWLIRKCCCFVFYTILTIVGSRFLLHEITYQKLLAFVPFLFK